MQDTDRIRRPSRKRARQHQNNIIGGLLLSGIGGTWLARQLGVSLPEWLFTWPMIPILVGLFAGILQRFKDFGWLILVFIGVAFLLDEIYPDIPMRHYMWPVLIICIGLMMMLSPRFKKLYGSNGEEKLPPADDGNTTTAEQPPYRAQATVYSEDVLEVISIFGNVNKNVFTKNFSGGEIISVFGGSEINLGQTDFTGTVVLDFVHIFGGSKLIIPPHWQVRSEMTVIFGGLDDKRIIPPAFAPDKVLVITGTTIFGGLEIKSYQTADY